MKYTQVIGGLLLVVSILWFVQTIKNAKLEGYGCYSFARDIGTSIIGCILGLAMLFDKVTF